MKQNQAKTKANQKQVQLQDILAFQSQIYRVGNQFNQPLVQDCQHVKGHLNSYTHSFLIQHILGSHRSKWPHHCGIIPPKICLISLLDHYAKNQCSEMC